MPMISTDERSEIEDRVRSITVEEILSIINTMDDYTGNGDSRGIPGDSHIDREKLISLIGEKFFPYKPSNNPSVLKAREISKKRTKWIKP